ADILRDSEYRHIDARPRIVAIPGAEERARTSLVALEHARTKDMALKPLFRVGSTEPLCAAAYLTGGAWRTGVLQQVFPFRYSPMKDVAGCFLPNEDGALTLFHTYGERSGVEFKKMSAEDPYAPYRRATILEFEALDRLPLGPRITPWGGLSS